MKKILTLLLLLFVSANIFAVVIKNNGLWYEVITKIKEAKVIQYKDDVKYSGNVVINETIEYDNVVCNVTSIDEFAFLGCEKLTSITIPKSLMSIGDKAFYGCKALSSVYISSLESWCDITFSSSYSCPLFYAQHLFLNGEEVKDLMIPSNVTKIGSNAFYYFSGLTSLIIPNSVKSIEPLAFAYCKELTSVDFSDGLVSIQRAAFAGCSSLTSIIIPNGITKIEDETFANCSALTSVTIPNTVTNIGNSAFYGCRVLTSIVIPNSVTNIDHVSFMDCSGLKMLYVGNNVKIIGNQAFANCSDLTDVYCYAEEVPTTISINNTSVFDGSFIEYATLHVPSALISEYISTEPWNKFKSIVAIDGDTPKTKKCSTPNISYLNGKLIFDCETEGVEFVSEITDIDIKKNYDSEVMLTATYNITVYATKSGYDNSDVAKATLCWIDVDPKTEGITNGVTSARAKAVMIQNTEGQLIVNGLDEGAQIYVYSTNGTMMGSAISHNGSATISTNLQTGAVAIVKIGERNIKVILK